MHVAKGVVASANVSKRSASPFSQRVTIESGTDKKEPSSGWIAYLSERGIGQGCVPPPPYGERHHYFSYIQTKRGGDSWVLSVLRPVHVKCDVNQPLPEILFLFFGGALGRLNRSRGHAHVYRVFLAPTRTYFVQRPASLRK